MNSENKSNFFDLIKTNENKIAKKISLSKIKCSDEKKSKISSDEYNTNSEKKTNNKNERLITKMKT